MLRKNCFNKISIPILVLLFVVTIACNKEADSPTEITWTGEKTYVYNDSVPFLFIKRVDFSAKAGIRKARIEKITYNKDETSTVEEVFIKINDKKNRSVDAEIIFDSKTEKLAEINKIIYNMELKDWNAKLHSENIKIIIEH